MKIIKSARVILVMLTVGAALLGIFVVKTSAGSSVGELIEQGHRAFAEMRYDEALTLYEEALERGSRSWSLPGLIETVKVRRDLGKLGNPVVHRAVVIFVTRRDVVGPDGGIASEPDVTDTQKERIRWTTRWLARVVEGLSRGRLTLTFDYVNAVSTYGHDARLKPDNPDHLDKERFFIENMNAYDTFITVSDTRSPARGLARRYPYVKGAIYGPSRGMFAVNAKEHHGPEIWLHEFFHTIEWSMLFKGTAHGWRDDGSNEYDFYRRHFEELMPQRGWRKMELVRRFPALSLGPEAAANYTEVLAAYDGVPLKTRQEAADLVKKARQEHDIPKKRRLLEQALGLSPYDADGLEKMVALLDGKREDEVYFEKLEKVLTFAQRFPVKDTMVGLGKVVGTWNLAQMSRTGNEVVWDVGKFINDHGKYDVSFVYFGGGKAVTIEWVALLADDEETSRDTHEGWSGSKLRDHIYTLRLSEAKEGVRYRIRARMRSMAGTNSNGVVLMRKVK